MNKILHIIVTGEEGKTKSFVVSKYLLKVLGSLFLTLLTILFLMSATGVDLFFKTAELKNKVAGFDERIHNSKQINTELEEQVRCLESEKEALITNAVGDLHEKSRLIESILSTVGVGVDVQESKKNSGGPYNSLPDEMHDQLMFRADRYLETILSIPLGSPVPGGVITSKFGRRQDPINKKRAFHDGVDIRGRRGTEIKATADGRIHSQGYDKGYGRFVIIDHGQGFRTMFGHLKKIMVKKGERIERGQVIGLLGNSGRSTGPHVHYEIRHRGRLVNPAKFMRIAKYMARLDEAATVRNVLLLAPGKRKVKVNKSGGLPVQTENSKILPQG